MAIQKEKTSLRTLPKIIQDQPSFLEAVYAAGNDIDRISMLGKCKRAFEEATNVSRAIKTETASLRAQKRVGDEINASLQGLTEITELKTRLSVARGVNSLIKLGTTAVAVLASAALLFGGLWIQELGAYAGVGQFAGVMLGFSSLIISIEGAPANAVGEKFKKIFEDPLIAKLDERVMRTRNYLADARNAARKAGEGKNDRLYFGVAKEIDAQLSVLKERKRNIEGNELLAMEGALSALAGVAGAGKNARGKKEGVW